MTIQISITKYYYNACSLLLLKNSQKHPLVKFEVLKLTQIISNWSHASPRRQKPCSNYFQIMFILCNHISISHSQPLLCKFWLKEIRKMFCQSLTSMSTSLLYYRCEMQVKIIKENHRKDKEECLESMTRANNKMFFSFSL